MSKCKSCDADIFWAKTGKGKSLPLDATPTSSGKWVVSTGIGGFIATFRLDTSGLGTTYESHWATCPGADQHRKPKPAPEVPEKESNQLDLDWGCES